jgi:hypothetical protein
MRFTDDRGRLAEENARLAERARQAANARDAAVAATANAAGRMQALATGMLADLRAMEERHSDEEVLADLLHLDHRTAQAGRLADSVAVLAGARTGRRWARPIVMESILRGAMGRISGYQRVRVHSASEAAVSGHAAEGVMHALAELLDNAANFSPPTAEVHVYVEQVPAGVIVSVEDSGLVMGDVQLRRAERAVSGDTGELGGLTGTRLGLAVVGRLARKHGLTVSFRPSARGGTGVLVLIPQALLAIPATPPSGPTAPLPVPAEPTAPLPVLPEPTAPLPWPAEPTATQPSALPAPAPAEDGEDADVRPRASYAAGRAIADLDPDPVPTHESPTRSDTDTSTDTDPDTDGASDTCTDTGTGTDYDPDSTGGLPKRHRGRTLAAAERGLVQAANTADTAGTAGRTDGDSTDADADADANADGNRDGYGDRYGYGARTRAARFSSFRQAVRGSAHDPAAARDDATGSRFAGGTPEGNATPASAPAAPERAPMWTAPQEATRATATGSQPAMGAPYERGAAAPVPQEATRTAQTGPQPTSPSSLSSHPSSHPEGDTTP